MKKALCFVLALITAVSCFAGCSSKPEENFENSDKISIVATIFPYFDFARTVTGDKADIKLLLSPGSEPHSYEPSPSDIVAIENCDIFIYNGGESDEWVESVLSSLQNDDVEILCMMDYIEPLNERNPDHSEGDEYDEHIWTSVRNAQRLVSVISEEISLCDGDNKAVYEENTENLLNELKSLDEEFSEIVSNSQNDTLVFGDRFPFLYFVTDYGLNYECAFPGCSSETEPSLEVVTRLIDFVRDDDIPVVFYIEFSNGKVAKLIAEDTGAKMLQFSSGHNITKDEFSDGQTYVSVMKQNAEALKEALS